LVCHQRERRWKGTDGGKDLALLGSEVTRNLT
jgi:hypothetical protein